MSGDHKIQVYKRVAEKVLPGIFTSDQGTSASRVKSKWESLHKTHSFHARRLYQTGGGIQDGAMKETDEFSVCYIPPEGPDQSATVEAQNIWDEINKDFPFFPNLHRFLSTRPNVTPIAVTTGVGPSGGKTVHYQAPEGYDEPSQPTFKPDTDPDTNIDPFLPATPDKENIAPIQTPAQGPKPLTFGSAMLDAAIAKASSSIKKMPQKRSIEDTFLVMQKRTIKMSAAHMTEESLQKQRKLDLAERDFCLHEFTAGLITADEYCKAIEASTASPSRDCEVIVINDSSDVKIEDDIKPIDFF
ncbi:hypothetical protein DXG01_009009 [Tephrocybe rancida]|nr:hypothetical protein DXG01_009009 [Tephrocybe rancida]